MFLIAAVIMVIGLLVVLLLPELPLRQHSAGEARADEDADERGRRRPHLTAGHVSPPPDRAPVGFEPPPI